MKTCTTPTQIENVLADAECSAADLFATAPVVAADGRWQADVIDGVTEDVLCVVTGETNAKVRSLLMTAGIEVEG